MHHDAQGLRVAEATGGHQRDVLVVAARISGARAMNLTSVLYFAGGATQAGQQLLMLLR